MFSCTMIDVGDPSSLGAIPPTTANQVVLGSLRTIYECEHGELAAK